MSADGMPEVHKIRDAEVRVFDQAPGTDDASDMYVMEALGVTVRIRRVRESRARVVIESGEDMEVIRE
jgi:hypothetical protein